MNIARSLMVTIINRVRNPSTTFPKVRRSRKVCSYFKLDSPVWFCTSWCMESHWTIEFAPIYEISLNPEPKICLNMHWVPGLGARIFHTKVLGKGKMLLRHFQRGHNKLRQGATSFQPRFKQVLVLLVTVHFLGPFSHKHWPAPKTITRIQPPCTLVSY